MDLRHLATVAPCARRLRTRWLVGLVAALAPGAASAQFMALTPPMAADTGRLDTRTMPAPDPHRAVSPQGRGAEQAAAGTLPNQRVGSSRPREVRDICIGCDR